MITRFKASNFTVFTELDVSFSSGINIFIGKNGTGKTHLMKVLYSACSVMNKMEDRSFAQKLNGVFMPRSIGRLVHRSQGRGAGRVVVYRRNEGETKERTITCDITTLNKTSVSHSLWKEDNQAESIFIPVKDMLANAPGFRISLYPTWRCSAFPSDSFTSMRATVFMANTWHSRPCFSKTGGISCFAVVRLILSTISAFCLSSIVIVNSVPWYIRGRNVPSSRGSVRNCLGCCIPTQSCSAYCRESKAPAHNRR